jgi:hypothetical protein
MRAVAVILCGLVVASVAHGRAPEADAGDQQVLEPHGPVGRPEMISNSVERTNGAAVAQAAALSAKRAVKSGELETLHAEMSTAAHMPRADKILPTGETFQGMMGKYAAAEPVVQWNSHEDYRKTTVVHPSAAQLLQAGARAGQDPEPAEVSKPPSDQIRMEPLAGTNGKPIDVFPLSEVGGSLPQTAEFANTHSYEEDLRTLVKDLDTSNAKAAMLRLSIVEKDNFLEGLQKRERLLRLDMMEHKNTLAALISHVQAVEARIDRIKQEKQILNIAAQRHQFEIAADKLSSEVHNVQQVSGALDTRIKRLTAGIAANSQDEVRAMRLSLQPSVANGEEMDNDAAEAVAKAANSFGHVSLLQATASRLRGMREKSEQ